MTKVFVKCMQGIGDLIYSRPFVKKLAKEPNTEVYLDPVIPELFKDIPGLNFVDPGTPKYRTQQKLYSTSKTEYVELPTVDRTITYGYNRPELKRHGIVSHMEHAFGFSPSPVIDFSLPYWQMDESYIRGRIRGNQNIAIIRPATVRTEWQCSSRNPEPDYINWCTRILNDAGYFTISIADCQEGVEWIEGDEPPAQLKLHKGELGILGTLNLIHQADVVVGGSGFIIPASVSAKTNLFVIFGGRGEYDNPRTVFDPRMNLKKIGWVMPDNFCRCNQMDHQCDKIITKLDDAFFNFLKQIQ